VQDALAARAERQSTHLATFAVRHSVDIDHNQIGDFPSFNTAEMDHSQAL
jgi:hypothetical protein